MEGKPSAEIVFAMRMLMVRFNLSAADILRVLVAMEKGE